MKILLIPLMAASLIAAAPVAVFAQESHGAHGTMTPSDAANAPSSQAYKAAMDKMHAAMSAQQYTSDADMDFAVGMIPHHQAAIDMAKTVLEHGEDLEIRKLAEEIIVAQEREIRQLEDWLKKHPAN
jgi:uncharacterized protein (DUF305 family)